MKRLLTCAIAIPARNEAELLPRCLAALAAQTADPSTFAVIVVANNCTDDTAERARAFAGLPNLQVEERVFAPGQANAGAARGTAMDAAAMLSDIILTTDADCVADPNWVQAMLAAFAKGVDAVAGAVSGDWEELRQQPEAALAIGKLEWDYLSLIAEAESLFDPKPHDPAPRHAQRCGANMGITRAMLKAVGGVSPIATGEDLALFRAVEQFGALVRHEPTSHVVASARMNGRAVGGMADAIAERLSVDYRCGEQFERADDLVARWAAQQRHRDGEGHLVINTMPERPITRLTPDQLATETVRLRKLIAAAK
jgi:glycosyltransferase involved in cell wall biosynthesis